MEIEAEVVRFSDTYGVNAALSKAVCLYESGGNPSLTSSAGAQGYFEVMSSTPHTTYRVQAGTGRRRERRCHAPPVCRGESGGA
jgi:hypothetical protein